MAETKQDEEPQVGDYIVLFDSESDEAGEPPILVVRVTEDGFQGIAEGWLDQVDRLEARARFLAQEQNARAWRLVGQGYTLLTPHEPARDVH